MACFNVNVFAGGRCDCPDTVWQKSLGTSKQGMTMRRAIRFVDSTVLRPPRVSLAVRGHELNPLRYSNPNCEIERIEEFEALPQDLLIRPVHLAPPLGDELNRPAFRAAELIIFQIGVMDDLGNLLERLIAQVEMLQQGFKRTVIADVGEIAPKHVEADCAWMRIRVR